MESQFYGDGQHNAGIYNNRNLNPYIYCYQNPVIYEDPNGKQNYSVILGGLERLITNTAAAGLGSVHATASAYSWGLGDLTGLTDPPKTFSRSQLISYYAGRAIADIAMIVEGGNIAGSGGATMLTGGGVLVGAGVAVYGAGVGITGTVDLGQSLASLMSLGADPENTSSSTPETETNSTPLKGGGKNGQHKNQQAKQSAQQKYEEAKSEFERLRSIPNKTKEDVKARDAAQKQMKHWQQKAQETGENHSQKAKGSN